MKNKNINNDAGLPSILASFARIAAELGIVRHVHLSVSDDEVRVIWEQKNGDAWTKHRARLSFFSVAVED